LPIAEEFTDVQVRYMWQHLIDEPKILTILHGVKCVSSGSYIAFLFAENELFRISIRLKIDNCTDYDEAVKRLEESITVDESDEGASIIKRGDDFFRYFEIVDRSIGGPI
jgi:hypothetical protein